MPVACNNWLVCCLLNIRSSFSYYSSQKLESLRVAAFTLSSHDTNIAKSLAVLQIFATKAQISRMETSRPYLPALRVKVVNKFWDVKKQIAPVYFIQVKITMTAVIHILTFQTKFFNDIALYLYRTFLHLE